MSTSSSVIKDATSFGADLLVEFTNKSSYIFEGAGHLESELLGASSRGGFFNSTIKGKFKSTRA